jgi:hypothetical protein
MKTVGTTDELHGIEAFTTVAEKFSFLGVVLPFYEER